MHIQVSRTGIVAWGRVVCLCAGDARVLDGHAFIVEAAVSVGGRDIKAGINVYRFANRIPLLFEVSLTDSAATTA